MIYLVLTNNSGLYQSEVRKVFTTFEEAQRQRELIINYQQKVNESDCIESEFNVLLMQIDENTGNTIYLDKHGKTIRVLKAGKTNQGNMGYEGDKVLHLRCFSYGTLVRMYDEILRKNKTYIGVCRVGKSYPNEFWSEMFGEGSFISDERNGRSIVLKCSELELSLDNTRQSEWDDYYHVTISPNKVEKKTVLDILLRAISNRGSRLRRQSAISSNQNPLDAACPRMIYLVLTNKSGKCQSHVRKVFPTLKEALKQRRRIIRCQRKSRQQNNYFGVLVLKVDTN